MIFNITLAGLYGCLFKKKISFSFKDAVEVVFLTASSPQYLSLLLALILKPDFTLYIRVAPQSRTCKLFLLLSLRLEGIKS